MAIYLIFWQQMHSYIINNLSKLKIVTYLDSEITSSGRVLPKYVMTLWLVLLGFVQGEARGASAVLYPVGL